MEMKRKWVLSLILAAECAIPVWACTPSFPSPDFLFSSGFIPNVNPYVLMDYLVYQRKDNLNKHTALPDGVSTLAAEEIDCAQCLMTVKGLTPDQRMNLVREYMVLAANMRKNLDLRPPESASVYAPELLLYLRGYQELCSIQTPKRNLTEVPASWKKLLALPPEQRKLRTVWVYYMLGNYMSGNLKHEYYALCRKAVRDGFTDTAGLALHSYKLEMRYGTDLVKVLHAGYEGTLHHAPLTVLDEWVPALKKIDRLKGAELERVLDDPLCREILMLFRGANPKVRKNLLSNGRTVQALDLCAFYAMEEGDIGLAEKYLKQVKQPTLLSLWLGAKAARFNGRTDEAVKLLREWLKLVDSIPPDAPVLRFPEHQDYDKNVFPFADEIYGQLGAVLVQRRDFDEAMDYFVKQYKRTFHQNEIAFLAERLMTLDQLDRYIQKHPDMECLDLMKGICARRAFRENKMDLAMKYTNVSDKLHNYLDYLKDGRDKRLDNDTRAVFLLNAAKILRHSGMELCGTQMVPDFYPGFHGAMEPELQCPDCKYEAKTGMLTLCAKHDGERRKKLAHASMLPSYMKAVLALDTTTTPQMRFHYRGDAAGIAYEAGELAQDPYLRAACYYFGGMCLAFRAPYAADIFYKRMIWKSWSTPLARAADKMRWFPYQQNAPMTRESGLMQWIRLTAEKCHIQVQPFEPQIIYPYLSDLDALSSEVPIQDASHAREIIGRAFRK